MATLGADIAYLVISALFIDRGRLGDGGGTLLVQRAEQLARGVFSVDVGEQNERTRSSCYAPRYAIEGRPRGHVDIIDVEQLRPDHRS